MQLSVSGKAMGCGCTSLQEFSGYLIYDSSFLKLGMEGRARFDVGVVQCALCVLIFYFFVRPLQ